MFFYVFFIFLMFFCVFECRVFVVFETKTYKITNMMHFSWAKTPFPCRVSVLCTSSINDFI